MAANGCLRIHREASNWTDRARAYQVLIDGQVAGEIGNGATADFAVGAGSHDLRLKINWTGSPIEHFSVSPDEVVEFRCRAAVQPTRALWELIRSFRHHDSWIQLERLPVG